MTEFFRFPSTPYLMVPNGLDIRDDKVLTDDEREAFLTNVVHVEEKIDGENLGMSFDGDELRFQARGSYVMPGGRRFRGIESWIQPRRRRIEEALGTHLVLFGEWCASEHSVPYNALPDWFLLFDVYERSTGRFWSTALRDELAAELGLFVVPYLGTGCFTLNDLRGLIVTSAVGDALMEGVVARVQDETTTLDRAKLVRGDFVQQIGEHWMTAEQRPNRLDIRRATGH